MEGFNLENIKVPEEELPGNEEGQSVDEAVESILATAQQKDNAAEGQGHEFLKEVLGKINHYSEGHHDEDRNELFPYWSTEKIQELHTALLRKMAEGLLNK